VPPVPTAEPFYADAVPGTGGRQVGVLLVHGSTGSPASMRPWGSFDPSSGAAIRARVSSVDVTGRVLENSYHVATLDKDAPTSLEESAHFVRRVTGP
jgi:esterase/lipase